MAKDHRCAVLNTCGDCGVDSALYALWIEEKLDRWPGTTGEGPGKPKLVFFRGGT